MPKRGVRNLKTKLLSIVLAFLCWLVIINVDDPMITKTFRNIPVNVLNDGAIAQMRKVYEIEEGKSIDVTVKGKKSIVDNLTKNDFLSEADLSRLWDIHAVPINVTILKSRAEGLERSWKPQTMVLKLEDRASAQFKVNITQKGSVEEGYSIGELKAKPNIVEVTGASSQIEQISELKVEVDVSNASEKFSVRAEPKVYDEKGNLIDSSNMKFSTTNIRVDATLLKTKTVPVNIETVGEPATGYVLDSLEYEPKKIVIAGTPNNLSMVNSIDLTYNISNISENKEEEVSIVDTLNALGVRAADVNQTSAVLKAVVSKADEKVITFETEDIEVKNLPDHVSMKYWTSSELSITLLGEEDLLKDITIEDLKPTIDMKNLSLGRHNVNVGLQIPDAVSIFETSNVYIEITEKIE